MPHGSELLFAIGAGDRLVGAVEFSDYPEAALKIPRVGGYSGLNIERILALQPDVILAWPEGNGSRTLQRLRELGLRVFVSDPNSYEDIARNLEVLGTMVGAEEAGRREADDFRQQVSELQQRYLNSAQVRVFYQIWHDPLMTQGGDTFISQAIALCGGRNIFADLAIRAPQVSIEAVLARNPEVIVASGAGDKRPQWLNDWQRYPSLTAVRSESTYHIPSDLFHRPTPRFLQGTRQLCQQLHKTRQWLTTQVE
ncbi:cobalamin-binding protein [Bacterioplanes sanyensis]|uniref:Cobalamin-binding protein n=2 Tax=Bacterioplanes sanyensis TaxID=1249553 RepID=A0A222FPE2_9GAMM|nr:cobalamin-binding protein [Bacterioplanes sanyensis]